MKTATAPALEPTATPLEISLTTALELRRLKLACLIDIRQTFELEIEGEISGACALPLFRFKQLLGHALTEDEQEILDGDIPEVQDMQHFFTLINRLHYTKDCILVCVCNSGRRSLHAAQLLRSLGYARGFSLAGGYRELKPLLANEIALPQPRCAA